MSDPLPKGNTASLTSAADAHSRAILLYVEGTTHGRKFMSAARAASLIKPVLVLQAGTGGRGHTYPEHSAASGASLAFCDTDRAY